MLRSVRRIPFWAKIYLGFTLIILVALSLIYVLTNEVIFARFDEFAQEHRLRQVRSYVPLLERQIGLPGGRGDFGHIQREIARVFRPVGEHVIFADEEGVIVGAADETLLGAQVDESTYRFVSPIRLRGQPFLNLWAGPGLTNRTEEEAVFLNAINRAIIISGLVAAAFGLLLAFWLIRQVTNPLRKLASATEKISHGQLGQKVEIQSQDAIGQLGDAFNTMSDRLAHSEELRRNMIADIAHELRTPLTLIQGNLQAILDGIYEPTHEKVSSIHEKSILLSRLIHDLQLLSLAEAGELPLHYERIELHNLVQNAVDIISPKAAEKEIAVRLSLADSDVNIYVDVERLQQVLLNLLSNAYRYTRTGGEIVVSTEVGDAEVKIHVSDTGDGIPERDLPYIFERFWRHDSSRARASGGSGLGLAIAKQLIEAHGGEIKVESEEGVGSTFTLTLPFETERMEARTPYVTALNDRSV